MHQIATGISEGRNNGLHWISSLDSCNGANPNDDSLKCPERATPWAYYDKGNGIRGANWIKDTEFRIECGENNIHY